MVIVPCCGVCNLGRLSVDAAQIAMQENGRKLISLGSFAAGHGQLDPPADLLVINGCEKNCATVVIKRQNCKEKWGLTISDLGITKRDDGGYNKDDLTLVVDAIEAACVDVGDQVPKVTGACAFCS